MKRNLAEEILKNASEIPIECQEKILDNMKAMVFTRNVMLKKQKRSSPRQTA